MAIVNFNGQLRANEIFGSIYNMIISQQVFSDNIKGTFSELVDKARVDGGLFGDTKLYYATDALKSHPWAVTGGVTNKAGLATEASNLLALDYPKDPQVQAISLDTFRQIRVTVDTYLTKRAFATEGAFAELNSITLGWIRDTKRVYDSTLYNAYVGTAVADGQAQSIEIDVTDFLPGNNATLAEKEVSNKLVSQKIAEEAANLFIQLKDVSRDYNDYGFLRSYSGDELICVWNSLQVNKIRKVDLPAIFHSDDVVEGIKFAEYVLPARYFGDVIATGTTATGVERSLVETDYTVGGTVTHVFPGDLIPSGAVFGNGVAYTENPNILFKLMHRNSIPYMSAFEVGTSWFNPRALTENHYLTFGHNTLTHLYNYPLITVKQKIS